MCVGIIILYYIIHTTTACPSPSIIFTQLEQRILMHTDVHILYRYVIYARTCVCVLLVVLKSPDRQTDRQTAGSRALGFVGEEGGLGVRVGDFHAQI